MGKRRNKLQDKGSVGKIYDRKLTKMAVANETKVPALDCCPCTKTNCRDSSVREVVAGVAVTPHLNDDSIMFAQSTLADGPLRNRCDSSWTTLEETRKRL